MKRQIIFFVNKMWNVGKYINGQVLNKLEGIDKSTLAVSKPMTVEDIDQMLESSNRMTTFRDFKVAKAGDYL